MITAAVISDTHNLLRPTVLEQLAGCDYILHGGDICRQEIVDRLREMAPLYVVRGNNDRDWAEQIPYTLDFTLEGVRFFMMSLSMAIPTVLPWSRSAAPCSSIPAAAGPAGSARILPWQF